MLAYPGAGTKTQWSVASGRHSPIYCRRSCPACNGGSCRCLQCKEKSSLQKMLQ